ncbi:MAG: OmpA family protein [Betaproteobacteria bacterium]|nr:OmpA family protein [Betaproteobacteria bacterium]
MSLTLDNVATSTVTDGEATSLTVSTTGKASTGITLEVVIAVGHTDAIGTDAYNQRLSVRRAEAVKAYLVSKGIPANRIYTEGKGKRQPVADNRTAAGRAKNRRVEVEVVGTRPRS